MGCNTIVGVQPSLHTSFYIYMVVFGNEVHNGSSLRLLTSMPMMLMQRWKGFFEKNNNGSSVKLLMSMRRWKGPFGKLRSLFHQSSASLTTSLNFSRFPLWLRLCLFVCLFVSLIVCLFVCLFVCPVVPSSSLSLLRTGNNVWNDEAWDEINFDHVTTFQPFNSAVIPLGPVCLFMSQQS